MPGGSGRRPGLGGQLGEPGRLGVVCSTAYSSMRGSAISMSVIVPASAAAVRTMAVRRARPDVHPTDRPAVVRAREPGSRAPVSRNSGSAWTGQNTAAVRGSAGPCSAARSRRAGCPARARRGPAVSQKSAVSNARVRPVRQVGPALQRRRLDGTLRCPACLDVLTRGLSSSCWIEPGMLSPSSGSEFWSPAITNARPAPRPPVPPCVVVDVAAGARRDVVGPEPDLVEVAPCRCGPRARRTPAASGG